MVRVFFELRNQSARGTDSLVADMMRHLYTRQHLGKALVICEHPVVVLGAARKQWLKLSRTIQKQRASTLNAEKLLKYTHAISRMQHMRFSAKSVVEDPEAEVYFTSPAALAQIPLHCMSVYLSAPLTRPAVELLVAKLPADALVVDYEKTNTWQELDLAPKRDLEVAVATQWQQVQQFLRTYDIKSSDLVTYGTHNVEAMDDALDVLLGGIGHQFLTVAADFQRAIELARPLRLNKTVREEYDMVILLAHRVQALSPGTFTQQFLQSYNEDDTYFLYDVGRGRHIIPDDLEELIGRHVRAGRKHLAEALRLAAEFHNPPELAQIGSQAKGDQLA